jgi:hypothetical protein
MHNRKKIEGMGIPSECSLMAEISTKTSSPAYCNYILVDEVMPPYDQIHQIYKTEQIHMTETETRTGRTLSTKAKDSPSLEMAQMTLAGAPLGALKMPPGHVGRGGIEGAIRCREVRCREGAQEGRRA